MSVISIEVDHHIKRAYIANYVATRVDSDILLYFPDLKKFASLNTSASSLWKIFERSMKRKRPLSTENLYSSLSQSYHEITAIQAAEAMLSFCDQLASAGVLKWEERP